MRPSSVSTWPGVIEAAATASPSDTVVTKASGVVTALEGEASLSRAGTTEGAEVLAPGVQLRPGDSIQTGDDAHLQLRLADGRVMVVGENADFTIGGTSDGATPNEGAPHMSVQSGLIMTAPPDGALQRSSVVMELPNGSVEIDGSAAVLRVLDDGETTEVIQIPHSALIDPAGLGRIVIENHGNQIALVHALERAFVGALPLHPIDVRTASIAYVIEILERLGVSVPEYLEIEQQVQNSVTASGTEGGSLESGEDEADGATASDLEVAQTATRLSDISPSSGKEGGDGPIRVVGDNIYIDGVALGGIGSDVEHLIGGFGAPDETGNIFDEVAKAKFGDASSFGTSSFLHDFGAPLLIAGASNNVDTIGGGVSSGGGGVVPPPPQGPEDPIFVGLGLLASIGFQGHVPVSSVLGDGFETELFMVGLSPDPAVPSIFVLGILSEEAYLGEAGVFLDNLAIFTNGQRVRKESFENNTFDDEILKIPFGAGFSFDSSESGIIPTDGSTQLVLFDGGTAAGIIEEELGIPTGGLSFIGESGNEAKSYTGTIFVIRLGAKQDIELDVSVFFSDDSSTAESSSAFSFFFSKPLQSAKMVGSGFLVGSAENDSIDGVLSTDDVLFGGDGDDEISGDGFDDVGGSSVLIESDDVLVGDQGDDTLDGFRGNDTLVGGVGNDVLEGGLGFDVYVFSSPFEGISVANGQPPPNGEEGPEERRDEIVDEPDFLPEELPPGGESNLGLVSNDELGLMNDGLLDELPDFGNLIVLDREGFGFAADGSLEEGFNFFIVPDFDGTNAGDGIVSGSGSGTPYVAFDPANAALLYDDGLAESGYTVIAGINSPAGIAAHNVTVTSNTNPLFLSLE